MEGTDPWGSYMTFAETEVGSTSILTEFGYVDSNTRVLGLAHCQTHENACCAMCHAERCVRALRARVRARVRACVRACVRVRMHVREP